MIGLAHSELIVNGYPAETFGRIGHRLSLFNERKIFVWTLKGTVPLALIRPRPTIGPNYNTIRIVANLY